MLRSTQAAFLVIAGALGPAGCGGGAPAPDQVEAPRIVSISPAVSRTLLDFDLEAHVVGRSRFCAALDQRIPAVGDLHDLDLERLIRLRPTHVLLQPPSGAPPDPELARLAQRHGWAVATWKLDSINDIRRLIADLPGVLYEPGGPGREPAARRAAQLLGAIDAALAPPPGASWRGRTLLVVGTDPVLVAGKGTYLDEILTALGAANAMQAPGWPELSLEDVQRLDPEAIVIVRERGAPGDDAAQAAGAIATLRTAAQRDGRVAVLADRDALLPSSAVAPVAGKLRAILESLATEPRP